MKQKICSGINVIFNVVVFILILKLFTYSIRMLNIFSYPAVEKEYTSVEAGLRNVTRLNKQI